MCKYLLLCLIGLAVSTQGSVLRRDVSHGYQYQAGHSSGGGGFLQAPTVVTTSSYAPTASGNSYYSGAQQFGNAGTSGFVPSTQLFNGGGNGGFSSSSSQSNYEEQQQYAFQHQAPIITKHFYIHSAPEDHDEQQIVRYVNVGRPQQNYRVVFIKTPSSSVSKAKIIANVAPVEDKTAIYVLAKKSNVLDVSAEVVTQAPVHHKPEVFFVKYKTPAEAEHAQHAIQAQYDSLGGSSQVSNEGLIPVSSVIGSLGGSSANEVVSGGSIGGGSIGGGSIGGGSFGGGSSFGGSSTGGSFSIDAVEQSHSQGPAVNIITTGDNTQQTYLPSHRK